MKARNDERRQVIAEDGLEVVAEGADDPTEAAGSANIRMESSEMPLAGMDCTLMIAEAAADLAVPDSALIVEPGTAHAGFDAESAVDIFEETPSGAPHDEASTVVGTRSSSH